MKRFMPLVFLALLCLVPAFVSLPYILHLLIIAFIYAIATAGWNMISGYAGQFSFGHAAFFGLGAYTVVLAATKADIGPAVSLLLGGLVAAAGAFLLGYPTFRLSGAFYSIATLAFAEAIRIVFTHFRTFTGGMAGVTVPFKGFNALWLQFPGKLPMYYITLAVLVLTVLATLWLEHSVFGLKLKALKGDEAAAASIGIDATRTKLYANIISGFFTGIAGGFYAAYVLVLDPNVAFGTQQSLNMVVYGIIGGIGAPYGPVIGALLLSPGIMLLNSFLGTASVHGLSLMVVGLVLVLVVLIWPEGLAGLRLRLRHTRTAEAEAHRSEGT